MKKNSKEKCDPLIRSLRGNLQMAFTKTFNKLLSEEGI